MCPKLIHSQFFITLGYVWCDGASLNKHFVCHILVSVVCHRELDWNDREPHLSDKNANSVYWKMNLSISKYLRNLWNDTCGNTFLFLRSTWTITAQAVVWDTSSCLWSMRRQRDRSHSTSCSGAMSSTYWNSGIVIARYVCSVIVNSWAIIFYITF